MTDLMPDRPGPDGEAVGTSSGGPLDEMSDGPAAPVAIGVPRTPTGRPETDALLARLADADHLPADGHVAVYEDVHRGLRDALTALDADPASDPYENRS